MRASADRNYGRDQRLNVCRGGTPRVLNRNIRSEGPFSVVLELCNHNSRSASTVRSPRKNQKLESIVPRAETNFFSPENYALYLHDARLSAERWRWRRANALSRRGRGKFTYIGEGYGAVARALRGRANCKQIPESVQRQRRSLILFVFGLRAVNFASIPFHYPENVDSTVH
ncbi:hypothetical protein EVAR_77329_1 [Eumeta japonica]|uniref:Uncharacterized protein n=1 Tax=Eumeta variegata TaxID=151549 RepID=A0A4C1UX65_EUMVA|nr:hypothetical protein EVAR_77329_1 [Eumeta japonica]